MAALPTAKLSVGAATAVRVAVAVVARGLITTTAAAKALAAEMAVRAQQQQWAFHVTEVQVAFGRKGGEKGGRDAKGPGPGKGKGKWAKCVKSMKTTLKMNGQQKSGMTPRSSTAMRMAGRTVSRAVLRLSVWRPMPTEFGCIRETAISLML